MPKYLFIFGFQTPRQWELSKRSLLMDDEDSKAVWIEAPNEELALNWGQEIAERFIRLLWKDESVSWRMQRFAFWIDNTQADFDEAPPNVAIGEFPSLDRWVQQHPY